MPMSYHATLTDFFSLLFTLLVLVGKLALAPASSTMSRDCQTLLDIKPVLGISTWNSTVDCCKWNGVTCSKQRKDRVTSLNLTSSGLTGRIPPSLANLSFLQVLDLSENHLQGIIPSALGSLRRLQTLYLYNNSLQGVIPDAFGGLSSLQDLDLERNNLNGMIPVSLVNCTNLEYIYLGYNKLTGGIPPSIANLSSLIDLQLKHNELSGTIPADLDHLFRLESLDLMFNYFSGNLPPNLCNFSSLYFLGLADNMLSGSLPLDFGDHLPNLEAVYLYTNHLEGHIPSSISNASKLVELNLFNNSFTGAVPSSVGSLVNLRKLRLAFNQIEARGPVDWSFVASLSRCIHLEEIDLTNNKFGGTLPNSIGNLSISLQWLRLRHNQITGTIPSVMGNLSGLTDLDMEYNYLSGPIPSSFGDLLNMNAFSLRGNILSGEIPSSLGNLVKMSEFYLNINQLSGSIPESFGSLKKLIVFDISYNGLSSSIPKQVIGVSSLSQYLNLSHNFLVGPLPTEVGKLNNLKALDASHNRLSGEIPRTLGDCQLLDYLNLQGNCFNGTIPERLSNLKAIQFLDLSQNQLSGHIPKFLETLPLQFLNLSFNNFEGEVPMGGIFSNLSSFSIMGNENLCGGNPRLNLKSCSVKGDRLSKPVLVVIIVISVLVPLLIMSLLYFCLRKYLPAKSSKKSHGRADFCKELLLKVSYNELRRSTNGFSASNLIGNGGYGSVYRGVLEADRQEVAIKVFNQQILAASKSFVDECAILKNIRHRNLVRIITACSTVDFNNNEFKALVYQFMSNGNLHTWLHKEEMPGQSNISRKWDLNLPQRLNIAIDIASGLDYLHNQIGTSIVHCDLKPSNILIDDDMTACICDFGISRILPPDSELVTTGIKGTIGYIPPECAMGYPITTYWDVYSFGILLLEMFTGKMPIEMEDGLTLHKYVEKSFPHHICNIIDERMSSEEIEGKLSGRTMECLVSAVGVALVCSSEQPKNRIEIKDALKQLEDAKYAFLQVGHVRKEPHQIGSHASAHLPC